MAISCQVSNALPATSHVYVVNPGVILGGAYAGVNKKPRPVQIFRFFSDFEARLQASQDVVAALRRFPAPISQFQDGERTKYGSAVAVSPVVPHNALVSDRTQRGAPMP